VRLSLESPTEDERGNGTWLQTAGHVVPSKTMTVIACIHPRNGTVRPLLPLAISAAWRLRESRDAAYMCEWIVPTILRSLLPHACLSISPSQCEVAFPPEDGSANGSPWNCMRPFAQVALPVILLLRGSTWSTKLPDLARLSQVAGKEVSENQVKCTSGVCLRNETTEE